MRAAVLSVSITEILAYGLGLSWALGLLPAAAITALKERWGLLGLGFLTLGLTWFVAALSLAPPDSWWGGLLLQRRATGQAADPLRHPRPRRAVALSMAGGIAAIVAVGLFASRPSAVLGVGGGALQHSVGGSFLDSGPCRRLEDGAWQCAANDEQGSSQVGYRVEVGRLGCWTATRVGSPGERSRKRLSGCITILDEILG